MDKETLDKILADLQKLVSELSEFTRNYNLVEELKQEGRRLEQKKLVVEKAIKSKNSLFKLEEELSKERALIEKEKGIIREGKLKLDKKEKDLASKQAQITRILQE